MKFSTQDGRETEFQSVKGGHQVSTILWTEVGKNSFIWKQMCKKIANFLTPSGHDYRRWERKNRLLRLCGVNVSEIGVAIDSNFFCITGLEENIFIDDYAAIGANCKIWNFNEVKIGKFCMFAADVTLTNGGHDVNSYEPRSGPLHIGNGCWLGNGARIVGSLKIGDNVIVAAGAVVVRDVPPGSIVAGIPAKIIGTRSIPEKVWHLGNVYFDPNKFVKLD